MTMCNNRFKQMPMYKSIYNRVYIAYYMFINSSAFHYILRSSQESCYLSQTLSHCLIWFKMNEWMIDEHSHNKLFYRGYHAHVLSDSHQHSVCRNMIVKRNHFIAITDSGDCRLPVELDRSIAHSFNTCMHKYMLIIHMYVWVAVKPYENIDQTIV